MYAKSSVSSGGHWQFIKQANGTYRIKNKNSGKFLANYGSKTDGAPIKQTGNPGDGALWNLVALQGGYFKITNYKSGMNLSLKSIPNSSEYQVIQTYSSVGISTWKFNKIETTQPAVNNTEMASKKDNWKSIPAMSSKIYDKYRIFRKNASINDITIASNTITQGAIVKKIVEIYWDGSTYKVITTLNGYYHCWYIRYRGKGEGKYGGLEDVDGIYINSTNSHTFKSIAEAKQVNMPTEWDFGYRR